jgi:hypothetical protein
MNVLTVEFAVLYLGADGKPVYHPYSDQEIETLLKEEKPKTAEESK